MQKVTICLVFIGVFFLVAAQASAEPTYVGAKKCKMCHLTEYKSWEKTKHAAAFDLLKDNEKNHLIRPCYKVSHESQQAKLNQVDCLVGRPY